MLIHIYVQQGLSQTKQDLKWLVISETDCQSMWTPNQQQAGQQQHMEYGGHTPHHNGHNGHNGHSIHHNGHSGHTMHHHPHPSQQQHVMVNSMPNSSINNNYTHMQPGNQQGNWVGSILTGDSTLFVYLTFYLLTLELGVLWRWAY